MLKKKFFLIPVIFILFIFTSCSRFSPLIFSKRLSPLHNPIKIFWDEKVSEINFDKIVIKKQGTYYFIPKKYNISWKYKTFKKNKNIFIWKSKEIDISNAKEIYFEEGKIVKK